ncbi:MULTISPECIES: phosphate acyltransferase PlsX [Haematobacter]|uniref:Phosphate acyltransferase n=2 Tax=Haematobacter TaxID=366614 RepID=A0A212ABW3_9RHOB|nr:MULTISPECIES: phosphate acyltransferase PlsX [Haematobacter]OWJ78203.1 phosphate acyltransferase [Haematobacter genomosp. 1]
MEPQTDTTRIVISVDAMGGDRGPSAVVDGIVESAEKNPDVSFLVHGNEAELKKLVARRKPLAARCEIRATERVVTMDEKPSYVMRNGAGTSMWSAVDSVRNGEAAAAVSCGNTGALMAVSMLRLRKLPGVNRPAIASAWPSRNAHEFNVMLDMGADVRADAEDLVQFAVMGASYARNALGLAEPRVGLLNVGTEENKGRAELKAAHELMPTAAGISNFAYIGFVEGNDILGDRADVIVTDGFTGNVALKTAEGTAKLVADSLREAFQKTPLSRMAALLAMPSLKRFSRRMDPRRSNGGVFLGLNGLVVKSHGSADATAMAAAINLAIRLARAGFQDRLASRVATALATLQTGETAGSTSSGATE